jgi:hypothetical protein
VAQAGLLTVAVAKQMQADIEAAMRKAKVTKAIFDNRETERPDEMVRAVMWTWITDCAVLERLALVLGTERNARRARETADRNRAVSSAFASEEEAIAWLRA